MKNTIAAKLTGFMPGASLWAKPVRFLGDPKSYQVIYNEESALSSANDLESACKESFYIPVV